MQTQGRGRSAPWAKVLAAFVLIVLMPLALLFLVGFQGSEAFPW
ncbi:hypothetical protein [Streptomyces californicus]